jgi:glutaredoxin
MIALPAWGKRAIERVGARALEAVDKLDERGGEVRDLLKDRLQNSKHLAAFKQGLEGFPKEMDPPPKIGSARSTNDDAAFSFGDSRKPAQVFGARSCPWSGRAIRLLEAQGVQITYLDLDHEGSATIRQELETETGQLSVPFIYLRGCFIGGFNALDEIHRLGQLEYLILPDAERLSHPSHGKVEVADRRASRDGLDRPPGS